MEQGLFDSASELADFRGSWSEWFPSTPGSMCAAPTQTASVNGAAMLRGYPCRRATNRKKEKTKNNSANAQCGGRWDGAAGSSCLTGTFSVLHVAGRKENSGAVDGHAGRPYAAMYEEAAK